MIREGPAGDRRPVRTRRSGHAEHARGTDAGRPGGRSVNTGGGPARSLGRLSGEGRGGGFRSEGILRAASGPTLRWLGRPDPGRVPGRRRAAHGVPLAMGLI
jgi:hypothetical protein